MMAETLVTNDDCNIEFLAEAVYALCGRQINSNTQARRIGVLVMCFVC
jgi:hypothetical protein